MLKCGVYAFDLPQLDKRLYITSYCAARMHRVARYLYNLHYFYVSIIPADRYCCELAFVRSEFYFLFIL